MAQKHYIPSQGDQDYWQSDQTNMNVENWWLRW